MNSSTNITSNVLAAGTYEFLTQNVKESPQDILCIESGKITIWPIKGDMFVWNAQSGKKIKSIPKKISIDSGVFIFFYNFLKNTEVNNEIAYFFLVDENDNNFVDEEMNLFEIK